MKLVTGGSGVIGRALVKKLVKRGDKVRIYDLTSPPIKHPNIELLTNTRVQAFVSTMSSIKNAIDKYYKR